MSQMSCRGSHNLKESPADLQALTTIQQNSFTPQPPHSRDPLTLTVCVTAHPSTTSRQHYFHRTVPLYMEGRILIVQGSVKQNVIFPAEHRHGSQGKARMRLPCSEHRDIRTLWAKHKENFLPATLGSLNHLSIAAEP